MQFRVPQFIDMEEKIIGPLTLKQFAYIVGAGGFSFLIWTFIPIKIIAIILILPTAGLFLALAFVKINNRPFVDMLESAFGYYTGSKVYTWKQPAEKDMPIQADTLIKQATEEAVIAKVNTNKLHDISLGLDVFDRNAQREEAE